MAVAPYGSWPSPISADLLVERAVSLSGVRSAGGSAWWSEVRPSEGGREVVVRDGHDVLPPPFSARTRVHEYGGGAWTASGTTLYFSNDADQRLWRADGGTPRPLTPPGESRYADACVSPDGRWLVCVRERHQAGVINDLVAVPAGGGEPVALAGGRDFFSSPRISPDGRRLAWLAWDHPDMPWDGTELWVAELGDGRLGRPRRVAGGPEESISQPRWSPAGELHWISDRSGWWNLYSGDGRPLAPMEAEFARPDWVFGQSSYTFLEGSGRLVAAWSERGIDRLGVVLGGRAVALDLPFTSLAALQAHGEEVLVVAASARSAAALVAVDVDRGSWRVLRSSREGAAPIAEGALSEARPVSFAGEGGRTVHALWYPPRLEGYEAPPGERPPLVVRAHGGPTAAASASLNLEVQYWTSRGVAVVDVNYGGSSGYGRAYRRRLDGGWGVVDVDDCLSAARHLASAGDVDGRRMAIRGSSAGGFTTLCALAFRPGVFAAGASRYGIADLEALAAETHKFEARYLDRLVAPYPEGRDTYRRRSPVHAGDSITAPLLLLQGSEDRVVPPAQAEALVATLRPAGVPFAYVTFEGEGHGFRRADSIRRAAEAELWFFGRALGFVPADRLTPLGVENEDALPPAGTAQRTSRTV